MPSRGYIWLQSALPESHTHYSPATAVLRWASSNIHNLRHDPVAALIASAFFTAATLLAWPALVALAVFGANDALGNWRTALTCAAGQVIGTLVSEGIVAYRVSHGSLPAADRYLNDAGCPVSWCPLAPSHCSTGAGWIEPRPLPTCRC